jgi:hypothetical protein
VVHGSGGSPHRFGPLGRPLFALLVAVLAVGSSTPAAAAEPAARTANEARVADSAVERGEVLGGVRPVADVDRVPRVAPVGLPTNQVTPEPEPVPAAPLEPFALTLFEEGDWVQQYTFEWCVGASVQMAWNMSRPDRRTAADDQGKLWEMARDRSNNPFRGADPGGWATLLNDLGLGPYELVSVPTYDEALRVAARAMRVTDRSVGLVMWRGRHAWVMSGFESLGDPAVDPDFRVTGVRVVDPLYPYGSGTWGPSPEPNQLLTPDQLATQFVFREQRRWSSHIPAGFLLVLPLAPAAVAQPRAVVAGPRPAPDFVALEAL